MDFDADRDRRGEEDAFVAALIELHRRKQRAARGASEGGAYARVLQHFETRGQRLRGERLITEELLERLVSSARVLGAAPVQQEIAIAGPVGGIAAGRFRVTNPSSEHVAGDFVVGDPLEGGWRPHLRFTPAQARLDPGGGCLVKVEAALGDAPGPAAVVLPIECRAGGRRDRIWLAITAFDAREGGP
jgi:hypothetical protein